MIHFVECTNPECRLRFPLDLSQFKGQYCPRCGAALEQSMAALAPTESPAEKAHTLRLWAILDNIRSVHNVGSIFRSADGAGCERLYLCGITPTPAQEPSLAKTALGAQLQMAWESRPNTPELVKALKQAGVYIIAVERAPNATTLFDFQPPQNKGRPVALVVGNERAGVDPAVLAQADSIVSIPMFGGKNSLNVSVAFGISAYWLRASQLLR